MTSEGERFVIEGRDLGYPTRFPSGSSMMGAFRVSLTAARSVLRDTPFVPAQLLPGSAVVSLNCVQYVNTDAGTYDEVALAILVDDPTAPRRAGSPLRRWRALLDGTIGAYSWRLGVSTTLSRDCGLRMWGFPKVAGDVAMERAGDRAEMRWEQDGALVLRYRGPARGTRTPPAIAPQVYSIHHGVPSVGTLTQRYEGVGYHLTGGQLDLGTHAFADELRGMGVSRRPLISIWNEHIDFEMSAPRPLAVEK